MRFDLYLETGPRHRKTMVHVLALPGCVAMGATTEAAIENARSAIRERLDFLGRHGEALIDPEPIELVVAEEDTTGSWLGFGVALFGPDREPISTDELRRQVTWLGWSREELTSAARALPGELTTNPAGGGRAVIVILHHVAGAERAYLNSVLGPLPGLNAALTAAEQAGNEPWDAFAQARAMVLERLTAMTDAERALVVQRGGQVRSTRRMLRRMLEHEWEHTLEVRARLER